MDKNKAPNQNNVDNPTDIRRFINLLLLALVASVIGGLISLYTDSTSFILGGSTSSHHTFASKSALTLATVFHLALIFGIILRHHLAWRAGFILPILWFSVAGIISFPQLYSKSDDWTTSLSSIGIPLACLAGMGVWQTLIWRRQWKACNPFFRHTLP